MSLAVPNYDVIRSDYLANPSTTIAELAAKYSISPAALEKRATREGWPARRRAISQEAQAVADRELVQQKAESLVEQNAAFLAVAIETRARVMACLSDLAAPLTPQELRMVALAAESAQRIGRLALGAATESVATSHMNPNDDPIDGIVARMQTLKDAH